MAPHIHYGICNLCDASCGIAVELDGRKVLSIKGDKEDPHSRGHLCPKPQALADQVDDPDRIRTPIARVGDRWEEIGWEEAYRRIAEKLVGVQRAHGDNAVGLYFGNPLGHNYRAGLGLLPFVGSLKTRNVYSANSVDAWPRLLVSYLMYGNQAALPVPDFERTDFFLLLGANPIVTNGSIMTAPDVKKRLKRFRERGGKMTVIDPRRSETAEVADQHLFIRPGGDAFLLASMIAHLFETDRIRLGALESKIVGLPKLRSLVAPFTPEKTQRLTGIEPKEVRRLAETFADAPSAVCYGRMGTCTQPNGSTATWLIDLLNLITGNFDRTGGAMFSTPAVDLAWLAKTLKQTGNFDRWRSRVGGFSEFNGELPCAALAQEMDTEGEGQIRAMITIAGNPVLTVPNGKRLDDAMANLEFMVSIDCHLNETTRRADIILPPTVSLENDHYPLLEAAMSVRNFARYAPAALAEEGGTRHDWRILADLSQRIRAQRGGLSALGGRLAHKAIVTFQPDRALDLLLRIGPHRLSLKKLRAQPHGIDLGPLQPRLEKILSTPNKEIDLAPPRLAETLEALRPHLESPEALDDGSLRLISQRTAHAMNSWLHNSRRLLRSKKGCALSLHPDDAKKSGVGDGEEAIVKSRVGEIRVRVLVTDSVMPGSAALPIGWGHDKEGSRLTAASENPGASINDIADERLVDALSSASVTNGIPITIQPAG